MDVGGTNNLRTVVDDSEEWNAKTIACEVGYYQKFETFAFNFLLENLFAIFPKSDVLFSTSQENIIDAGLV